MGRGFWGGAKLLVQSDPSVFVRWKGRWIDLLLYKVNTDPEENIADHLSASGEGDRGKKDLCAGAGGKLSFEGGMTSRSYHVGG